MPDSTASSHENAINLTGNSFILFRDSVLLSADKHQKYKTVAKVVKVGETLGAVSWRLSKAIYYLPLRRKNHLLLSVVFLLCYLLLTKKLKGPTRKTRSVFFLFSYRSHAVCFFASNETRMSVTRDATSKKDGIFFLSSDKHLFLR